MISEGRERRTGRYGNENTHRKYSIASWGWIVDTVTLVISAWSPCRVYWTVGNSLFRRFFQCAHPSLEPLHMCKQRWSLGMLNTGRSDFHPVEAVLNDSPLQYVSDEHSFSFPLHRMKWFQLQKLLLSTYSVQTTVCGAEKEVKPSEKLELGKITEFMFEGPILSQTKPLKQIKIRQLFPYPRNTWAYSAMPELNSGISGLDIWKMNDCHIL